MNILVFEDDGVYRLFPITTGRPAYAVSCASFRLIDLMGLLDGHLVGDVRGYLTEIQQLDFPSVKEQLDPSREWTLAVNARTVPSIANVETLKHLAGEKQTCLIQTESTLLAALMPTKSILDRTLQEAMEQIGDVKQGDPSKLSVFEYPHDVIRENMECFESNLAYRIENGNYQEVAENVFVEEGAHVADFVVTQSDTGAIVIDRGSTIGPFSFLRGPVYIGPNCRVNEHSSIKDCVSLAHTIKIGGEVEGTVIEAYSNKQHHGFLGHSYLGSWINLGAGTCNSDLKNTYGIVNMNYDGEKVATGMQFVGCVIGDYTKSAINTSIFTGKTIGVCSMLYGFVTSNVPSFVNYARSFGQTTEMPAAVMLSTQERMFGRRKVQQRPCHIRLIEDMYQLTLTERQLSESPLSF